MRHGVKEMQLSRTDERKRPRFLGEGGVKMLSNSRPCLCPVIVPMQGGTHATWQQTQSEIFLSISGGLDRSIALNGVIMSRVRLLYPAAAWDSSARQF